MAHQPGRPGTRRPLASAASITSRPSFGLSPVFWLPGSTAASPTLFALLEPGAWRKLVRVVFPPGHTLKLFSREQGVSDVTLHWLSCQGPGGWAAQT